MKRPIKNGSTKIKLEKRSCRVFGEDTLFWVAQIAANYEYRRSA